MCINWIDDIISAVISTVLAIGVSYFFYRKSNRNAAKNDILLPLSTVKCDDNISLKIMQYKSLFSYRYLKSHERKAIEQLQTAYEISQKYLYPKMFSEAIWEYFYAYCKTTRYHISYIHEIDE